MNSPTAVTTSTAVTWWSSTSSTRCAGRAGAVHGGLVASLADRAGAYAAVRAGQRPVVTSSVALSYLSGATAGPLRAEATVLRSGRQQGVVEVRLHDGGRHDALVATALLTVSYLPGEVPGPLPASGPRPSGSPSRARPGRSDCPPEGRAWPTQRDRRSASSVPEECRSDRSWCSTPSIPDEDPRRDDGAARHRPREVSTRPVGSPIA